MRILIVAPGSLPVPGGGSVEICIYRIARWMAKQHQVTVVCRRFPGQAKVSRSGNLAIVRISANTRARYLAGVLRHARETRYDVIQVDNRPHNAAFIKGAFPASRFPCFSIP